jgi:hypothetical protein
MSFGGHIQLTVFAFQCGLGLWVGQSSQACRGGKDGLKFVPFTLAGILYRLVNRDKQFHSSFMEHSMGIEGFVSDLVEVNKRVIVNLEHKTLGTLELIFYE